MIQHYSGSTWTDETAKFDVVAPGTSASLARDVLVDKLCSTDTTTYAYDRGLYRVTNTVGSPPSTSLVCGYVTSNPAVPQFAHYFKFSPMLNPGDLGTAGGVPPGDGVMDNNDYIVFITYFFASDTRADLGVAGGLAGEDGMFNNNDFIAFIDWQLNANDLSYTEPCSSPAPRAEGGEAESPATDDAYQARVLNALWDVYNHLPEDNPHRTQVMERIVEAMTGGGQ